MTIEVRANRDRCQGAGQCVLSAPDVFDQSDEDGLVELLTQVVDEDRADAVSVAVDLCPAHAIELVRTGAR